MLAENDADDVQWCPTGPWILPDESDEHEVALFRIGVLIAFFQLRQSPEAEDE